MGKRKGGQEDGVKSYFEKEEYTNTTPPGEKKDMSGPMEGAYKPAAVEAAWYDWWDKMGFFEPKERQSNRGQFTMVLPPPNVTGSLHLGHALMGAVEDALVRWHRMLGKEVLWLPGLDHAGIATQTVVERKLTNKEGITRHDLGREEFVRRVWEWKEEYGGRIFEQFHRLAASMDWKRSFFTLDEVRAKAVQEAFVRLHEAGLIYRANRLVNWSCTLRTAISDIEVDYKDIPKNHRFKPVGHERAADFGQLTHFAYKIHEPATEGEELVVATTRPETILGDTGVAVHPNDPRYTHLHGKFAIHPFSGRIIPIVLDAELVDMEFGTGAVKLTPAHDPNDFEAGKRHNLEFINILNDDGTLNENGAPYTGEKRFDVRTKIVKDLEAKGLLRGVEGHEMRLGICSRSGDIVEPMLRPQWYVDCEGMAAAALKAVREGEMELIPSSFNGEWERWLTGIRPWCISRQLWWGHRIPAYLIVPKGMESEVDTSDQKWWFVARSEDEALDAAAAAFSCAKDSLSITQDPDVLDTWFSSGLLPFSGFGWPEETPELEHFFPGDLLETGSDILFFWVARMVMMSLQLTGKVPFRKVFLHPLVRDKTGKKMSKTLGNVIDPIDVMEGITLEELHEQVRNSNLAPAEIERALKVQNDQFPKGIPPCGSDALRFALLSYTAQGSNINLDPARICSYREFCNKMWQATKFALLNLEDFTGGPQSGEPMFEGLSFVNQWILSRLNSAVIEVNKAFEAYRFADATDACYRFFMDDLCSNFIELMKPIMRGEVEGKEDSQLVLYTCLSAVLRLMHPLMPFVTEELWQRLPGTNSLPEEESSIMIQPYPEPKPQWDAPQIQSKMVILQSIIQGVRSMRATYSLAPSMKVRVFVRCGSPELADIVQENPFVINTLAYCEDVQILSTEDPRPEFCAINIINEKLEAFLYIKGLINVEAELQKLGKALEKNQKSLEGMRRRVAVPDYETKVPERVREQNSIQLNALEEEAEKLAAAITSMEALGDAGKVDGSSSSST